MDSSYAQTSRDDGGPAHAGTVARQGGGDARPAPSGSGPASAAQRSLQATLNDSPRTRSLAGLKPMLSRSPRVAALAERSATLQGRFVRGIHRGTGTGETDVPAQLAGSSHAPAQTGSTATANRTGLPDRLKAGIEALSGMDLSQVRTHTNSLRPAQLNALAYAQGNDIHVAPGQERHIPHEAWHVVQQRQGRVRPTLQVQGVAVNDDRRLEREADAMGSKALQMKERDPAEPSPDGAAWSGRGSESMPVQCVWEKLTEADPGWRYFRLLGYYYHAESDTQYYPDTRMLDERGEPGGLRELDEDEAADLQHQIESGHWTGLWVNTDNDMTYDPRERVLSFVDEPQIRVPVDARENYFTLLDIARDGGDVDTELRAALDELDEDDEEVPARQITRGAKIGFEFQELGSKVAVTEPPSEDDDEDEDDIFDRGDGGQKEYALALSRVPERIPTELYGKDNRWYVVADGENLEFVTMPFESLADLRATMAEVRYVAWVLADGRPDTSYLLGDTVVRVHKAERRAQPQVNPDIPLDTLHNFIEDLAEDQEMQDALFGASEGFWNPQKTTSEMAQVFAANDAIQGLDDGTVRTVFGVANDGSAAGKVASIKGMLQLLANAAIHRAFFGAGLDKDQPILLKTHMGKAWKSLVKSGVIAKGTDPDDVIDLLLRVDDSLSTKRPVVKHIVTRVMGGTDPVWASEKKAVGLDSERRGRKQVVIELRRVPVLPIDEWTEFAEDTYRYFIMDAAERFS